MNKEHELPLAARIQKMVERAVAKGKGQDRIEILKQRAELAAERSKLKEWKRRLELGLLKKQEALEEAGKYPPDLLRESVKNLNELVAKFQAAGTQLPDFLQAESIQHNPEAAAFAMEIAQLPVELQHDPFVLYQKATKLYRSTSWSELSNEAHAEARGVLYRTFEEIRKRTQELNLRPEFGRDADVDLLYGIDSNPDIYKTMPRIVPEPAGEMPTKAVRMGGRTVYRPNKDSQEFEDWQAKKIAEEQASNVSHFITEIQLELDETPSAYRKQAILSDARTQLTKALRETRYDRQVGTKYSNFSREGAKPFLDRILEYEKRLAPESQIEQISARASAIVRFEDVAHFLTKEQQADLKSRIERGEDAVFEFQRLTKEDARDLSSGPDGQAKWWTEKIFDIFGQGRERAKQSLIDEYQKEDVEKFFKWVYGKTEGEAYLTPFRFLWSDYARQDYFFKALMYQGGDPKDKLKALQALLGADIDNAAQVRFANKAISLYNQVLDEHQADKTTQWVIARDRLLDKVDDSKVEELSKIVHPEFDEWKIHNDKRVGESDGAWRSRYNKALNKNREGWKESLKIFRETTKKKEPVLYKYYLELRKLHLNGRLPQEYYKEFNEIELLGERVARGTILTDSDVLVYNEIDNQLSLAQQKLDSLEAVKQSSQKLGDPQQKEYDRLKDLVAQRLRQRDYLSSQMDAEIIKSGEKFSARELAIRRGYSSMEWEIRRRLVPVIEKEIGKLDPNGGDEWMVRRAVFAARMTMIGTGHMMTVGAMDVIPPMAAPELKDITETFLGKSIMWSPFMEDIVRIINPDYFEERFGMADPWGKRMRAIQRANLLKQKGYGLFKDGAMRDITHTKEYEKYAKLTDLSPEEKLSLAYMDFAREETGIHPEYLLSEGWLRGGGAIDASLWRPDAGLLDELQAYFDRIGQPHAWKNVALWLQFAVLDPDKPENIGPRKVILNRALDRAPSKFFHLFAGKIVDDIKKAHKITDPEWRSFMRALSVTETQLWQDTKLVSRDVNLREGDFGLLAENLEVFFKDFGIEKSRVDVFRLVLKDLHREATQTREGRQFATRLDAIARQNFPLTLSYADLDWGVANFFKLGTTAFDRRGRDNAMMVAARDLEFKLKSDPELVRPRGEKGWEEYMKTLYEFRTNMNAYEDPKKAARASYELLRLALQFNRSHLKDWRNPLGYIPGLGGLLRNIAEVEPEHMPVLSNLPFIKDKWIDFLNKNNLIGKKIKDWPNNVADAVSLSVRYFGKEAEDLDLHRIDHIIDMAQMKGVLASSPELYGALRREFGTGLLSRLADTPRKYWWIVIAATVVVAAMEAESEERKKK